MLSIESSEPLSLWNHIPRLLVDPWPNCLLIPGVCRFKTEKAGRTWRLQVMKVSFKKVLHVVHVVSFPSSFFLWIRHWSYPLIQPQLWSYVGWYAYEFCHVSVMNWGKIYFGVGVWTPNIPYWFMRAKLNFAWQKVVQRVRLTMNLYRMSFVEASIAILNMHPTLYGNMESFVGETTNFEPKLPFEQKR